MKISKLFHWLYAVVMLLPVFAIGTSCLISTFNMTTKEITDVVYSYESNDISSSDDFIEGNIYKLDTRDLDRSQTMTYFYCDYIEVFDFSNTTTSFSSTTYGDNYYLSFYYDSSYNNFVVRLYNGNTFVTNLFSNGYQRFTIINASITNVLDSTIYNYLSLVPLNEIPIESVDTHNLSAEDVFYNAVDRVTQSNLFSWAYDSFLVTPFAYIVSLFSMPANSPVVMLLSYWLAVSIIWLVFDLVMYIPLLVHRWLDKGVLE